MILKLPQLSRLPYWYILAVPALLFVSGVASNQAVLVANWGKFPAMLNQTEIAHMRQNQADEASDAQISAYVRHPVKMTNTTLDLKKATFDADGMIDDVHCIMSHSNHLKFLADWINLGSAIASPGDLLLLTGAWLWGFAPLIWGTLAVRKLIAQEKQ
jgi:hypothetical protein